MTISPFGADWIEKLTAISEKNRVSTIWTPRHGVITQDKTVDGLARKGKDQTNTTGTLPATIPEET